MRLWILVFGFAGASSGGAQSSAAAVDAQVLARAQHPSAAQESAWMDRNWKDPSPHRASSIAAGTMQLGVLDWGGTGTALVFLPGMGHTAHVFDQLAPRFTDRYHTIGLTLRGHGESSAPSHAYTADSLATDVRDAIVALGLHNVVLAGHSLGGHVANRVAALYPSLIARVIYIDAAKDSTGLAALRAAAPTMRPQLPDDWREIPRRAHGAQRKLYFNYWSDAQEADFRHGNTAPEIPAMADLLALQSWKSVRQPQLDICALDTAAVQFPWLTTIERDGMRAKIDRYVSELYIPWERAACDRFQREAPHGTLVVVPASSHYVFLVSPEQTYRAMRRWLDR